MSASLKAGKKFDNKAALFFLAPSLIGFLTFFFGPFAGGLYYSFVDSPVGGSFVGLSYYFDLLRDTVFQQSKIWLFF